MRFAPCRRCSASGCSRRCGPPARRRLVGRLAADGGGCGVGLACRASRRLTACGGGWRGRGGSAGQWEYGRAVAAQIPWRGHKFALDGLLPPVARRGAAAFRGRGSHWRGWLSRPTTPGGIDLYASRSRYAVSFSSSCASRARSPRLRAEEADSLRHAANHSPSIKRLAFPGRHCGAI